MIYPPDMDKACIPLCDVLNALIGVTTTESCEGHGRHPYRVFFECSDFTSLKWIAEAVASSSWKVEALYHNGSDTLGFMLEGAIGHPEYADHLVQSLK